MKLELVSSQSQVYPEHYLTQKNSSTIFSTYQLQAVLLTLLHTHSISLHTRLLRRHHLTLHLTRRNHLHLHSSVMVKLAFIILRRIPLG